MTPPALDLPPLAHVVRFDERWTRSAVSPWREPRGSADVPAELARAPLSASLADIGAPGPLALARLEELRRALGLRDADAVDRWASARVMDEFTRVLGDDEVVAVTPEEFLRGNF